MTDWIIIPGDEAVRLADAAKTARSGTYSAAAAQWIGEGRAPLSVNIRGILKCGYCGGEIPFFLKSMTGQFPCSACGASFTVFNTNQEIDGRTGIIIMASVYSHPHGTAVILPSLEIVEIAADEGALPEQAERKPRYLDVWDSEDPDKIMAFLEAGGDLNARDDDGWTPLHRAAFMDLVGGVRLLLDFGADPDLPVLLGHSKRTIEIVRNNRKPNAHLIEQMLIGVKK